jgi:hypothetical protein
MATRPYRLSEFRQDLAPVGEPLEALCEDHNGTYTIPYPCLWSGGLWFNAESDAAIEADVIGWRTR